jgi:hypothetical protein
MSYLNALRLHFAGRFQANVSTVNNDPAHYDNASFQASYQGLQGAHMQPPNGWFNPQGDAAWRLLGCKVTSAWMPGGPSGAAPSTDPVLGYLVADSDSYAPAKLVDLDPEQQLVSEIWGLQVRLAQADGTTVMQGDFDPAAFIDIWDRSTNSAGGDTIAGAMYQSVLTNLTWGDVSGSPFLSALKQAATDGMLSIKFNVDSFNMSFKSPDFMTGRITGTIGPAALDEPRHVVMGRQFMAAPGQNPNFFVPAGGLNFCCAVVDTAQSCVFVDLGNALTTGKDGVVNDQGDLVITAAGASSPLGTIPSQGASGYASDPSWYARTAGVVVLPLTAAQLAACASAPLTISGNTGISISEWESGAFVRADRYVYRLSPGQPARISVVAMQFGQPLAGATIGFVTDASQLQPPPSPVQAPYLSAGPPVATPGNAIRFQGDAVTGAEGRVELLLETSDPGTPRYVNGGYGIDGQVYGIRPGFVDAQYSGPVNQWNFISVLLWSGFVPSNPVTWDDLQPIFQQYANLYPVMNRFLDLGSYESVVRHRELLSLAFGLDAGNPNAMPVTRDLSPAKRDAILAWLERPVKGTVVAAAQAQEEARATVPIAAISDGEPVAAASKAASGGGPPPGPRGGKASAAARRQILQTKQGANP